MKEQQMKGCCKARQAASQDYVLGYKTGKEDPGVSKPAYQKCGNTDNFCDSSYELTEAGVDKLIKALSGSWRDRFLEAILSGKLGASHELITTVSEIYEEEILELQEKCRKQCLTVDEVRKEYDANLMAAYEECSSTIQKIVEEKERLELQVKQLEIMLAAPPKAFDYRGPVGEQGPIGFVGVPGERGPSGFSH
jgi:hypothetical protein